MFKFKNILTTVFCFTTLASCTVFHTGCKKTVEQDKVTHKSPDGTTEKYDKTVKEDDKGNQETTVQHSVDHK